MALPYTFSAPGPSCSGTPYGCCKPPVDLVKTLCPPLPEPPDACATNAPGLPYVCAGGQIVYPGVEYTSEPI